MFPSSVEQVSSDVEDEDCDIRPYLSARFRVRINIAQSQVGKARSSDNSSARIRFVSSVMVDEAGYTVEIHIKD